MYVLLCLQKNGKWLKVFFKKYNIIIYNIMFQIVQNIESRTINVENRKFN